MTSKLLLTVFGATGKQGGSVLEVVLARPDLSKKYALRGITRDPSSSKSQALAARGVEMVQGDLNDLSSLKTAVQGSYGVFGVTDFWSLMDKNKEIQQGKNIFAAVKEAGVKHYVWSGLPSADKLSEGVLQHVDHFEGKALVGDFAEANKGDMIVSIFMPAMFIDFSNSQVKVVDGTPTIALPFPSDSIDWPLIDPHRDGGKYVLGLFEGGEKANGVKVHAVSTWSTPKGVVEALSAGSDKQVVFKAVEPEVFGAPLPAIVKQDLTEMMLLIGNYNYFGKGSKERQAESDKWLIPESTLITYPEWVKQNTKSSI